MRRLAALAITLALGWSVVLEWGSGGSTKALPPWAWRCWLRPLPAGWSRSSLAPRDGYLLFGLICGPVVANILTTTWPRSAGASDSRSH